MSLAAHKPARHCQKLASAQRPASLAEIRIHPRRAESRSRGDDRLADQLLANGIALSPILPRPHPRAASLGCKDRANSIREPSSPMLASIAGAEFGKPAEQAMPAAVSGRPRHPQRRCQAAAAGPGATAGAAEIWSPPAAQNVRRQRKPLNAPAVHLLMLQASDDRRAPGHCSRPAHTAQLHPPPAPG
jgi:hypothetical protein